MQRNYTTQDNLILKLEQLHQVLCGQINCSPRENPAMMIPNPTLTEEERRHIAGLMRVNHTGEVCAQALYDSQAVLSHNPHIKQHMRAAAEEEYDHLHWCQQRLIELNSHVSWLNPLWYTCAWCIGAVAALVGDRWNLGFVAETEHQVTAHLKKHREKIPAHDQKTHVILRQMQQDESQHADAAIKAGGTSLPTFLRKTMTAVSKVMTTIAYWV